MALIHLVAMGSIVGMSPNAKQGSHDGEMLIAYLDFLVLIDVSFSYQTVCYVSQMQWVTST
jgi:hypothetical protein